MFIKLKRKQLYFIIFVLMMTICYGQECINGSIIYNSTTDEFNFCENGVWTSKESYNGTVVDINGNVYKTVKIGNQWWMAENLKVTHYRTGEAIPNVTDNTEWWYSSTGAYCSYDNNDSNIGTYGLLYNWYAVDDSRQIAPNGWWRVPTDEDWKQLEMNLGMSQSEADKEYNRGTDEGSKLKLTSGWIADGNGTNESGFSAVPGGIREGSGSTQVGSVAYFWTVTEFDGYYWYRSLSYNNSSVYRNRENKNKGLSVRCVKGDIYQNTPPYASFTVNPAEGTTANIYAFDASGCTDFEDDTSVLEVRWDWENDGTWDTNYTTTKTATYQYSTSGLYTVKLELKDSWGLTTNASKMVKVNPPPTGTLTDIDGNVYNTIMIGDQLWMAENLKVTHYKNGDPIPHLIDDTDWQNPGGGAYCFYDDDYNNVSLYGNLYNWFAINESRGIAPEGWHVPSDDEWKQLEMFLGMTQEEADRSDNDRGVDEGSKLKSMSGWEYWENSGNGTNESGFNGLPSGVRSTYPSDVAFGGQGKWTYFWTSTYLYTGLHCAWTRDLEFHKSGISRGSPTLYHGYSVRCIKD